jgi:HAD superfamily phosphatase (TIGR01668 family)
MFNKFVPDFIFDKFDDVTTEFLKEQNIEFLFIDIDNTLAPYEEPTPNERVVKWFSELKACGIKAMLVSNNHADRVELFNKELGLPAYADVGKPLSKKLKAHASELGAVMERSASLGDQIFTDVWAARALGARAILVPPIKDKTNLFFRFKRWLEKPFVKKYKKLHEEK